MAHADRGLFEARKEGNLRRPAEDPLRSTEGRLSPTEDLRQADGALKGIISVRELKGIHLFYYLIDAAEFSDFNDMH